MTRVHVIGAAGFAGAQLAALIDEHPSFELGQITARGDSGKRGYGGRKPAAVVIEFEEPRNGLDPVDFLEGEPRGAKYPVGGRVGVGISLLFGDPPHWRALQHLERLHLNVVRRKV